MSPAKLFAYMKKRESQTKQEKVEKVSSITRDLFDPSECAMKSSRCALMHTCFHLLSFL